MFQDLCITISKNLIIDILYIYENINVNIQYVFGGRIPE